MLCLDNSEYMRNGDFLPTRLAAQSDAANLIAGAKQQGSVENTVGVMSMADESPCVLVAPTNDAGKIMASISNIQVKGELDLVRSIKIAQIALRHRGNKNAKPRIVLFVGSPVANPASELRKLGMRLKKRGVSVDVINFGEDSSNAESLEAFVNAVNPDGDTSHLLTVPSGPHILSDIVMSSQIVLRSDPGAAMGAAAVGGDAPAGMGAMPGMSSEDAELEMVLRLSEQTAQEEAARRGDGPAPSEGEPQAAAPAANAGPTLTAEQQMAIDGVEEEDLKQAILLSMAMDSGASAAESSPSATAEEAGAMDEDEEGELRQALMMSQAEGADAPAAEAEAMAEDDEEEEMRKALEMSQANQDPRPDPAD